MATLSSQLRKRGYDQLSIDGVRTNTPGCKMVGRARTLRFAPFAGVEVHPLTAWDIDWLRLQLETRWLAPDVDLSFAVVDWVAPGDRGAIAVNFGVGVVFSDLFKPEGVKP